MSDQEHKMSGAERRNLKETFAAVQAGTSEPGEFAEALRDALGLPEGTDWQEVVLKHFKPSTDAHKLLEKEMEKAGILTKERDDARAEVAAMKTERNEAKVDAELRKALDAAGILPEFVEDAMLRAKAVGFVVNDKGQVVTKPDAKDTIPNASPAAWVQGELKAKAARFWPTSIGGGAKGGGFAPYGIDVAAFRGGTLTEQYAVIARVGEKAVLDSLRRAGITPPPYLKGGGR